MKAKRIFCTVTNDLSYDQRMIRICGSLAKAGYSVTLVGRKMPGSVILEDKPFRQHRLAMLFHRGKLFYLEYSVRLFFYLLFRPMDAVCAIDLDTIFPCLFVSRLRGLVRIYDAHELFCEMQEVVSRPHIYRIWKAVERFTVPSFPNGYTVNDLIAAEFHQMYGMNYEVIRNMPLLMDLSSEKSEGSMPLIYGIDPGERFILYQGAVNEGRCFETLIPAMLKVNAKLVICGEGNFLEQLRALVRKYDLGNKVIFTGYILPDRLKLITRSAWVGVTLFDRTGISNYYSLANRFFDYIEAEIPQVAVDYPAYREINNLYHIAVLVQEPGVTDLSEALNELLNNLVLHQTLKENCKQARLRYNWQEEEKRLFGFYEKIFP